jgi:hypothetical protein
MRSLVLAVVIGGAAGSIALLRQAGSRQASFLLMALFTVWVLSPFVVLGWATFTSNARPPRHRAITAAVAVMVTLWSLAMYDGVLPMPANSRPAAVYLVVPLLSWVLFAILAGAFRGKL